MVASMAAIMAYGWVNLLLNPVATILSGQMAGKQFENSDVAYITSLVGMSFFSHLGIPFVILLIVLTAIWWRYLRMGFTKTINDAYAAQKLAEALPILQALAQLKVQEGLGQGLSIKGLPIVVTPDMINALIGLAKSAPQPAVPPAVVVPPNAQ